MFKHHRNVAQDEQRHSGDWRRHRTLGVTKLAPLYSWRRAERKGEGVSKVLLWTCLATGPTMSYQKYKVLKCLTDYTEVYRRTVFKSMLQRRAWQRLHLYVNYLHLPVGNGHRTFVPSCCKQFSSPSCVLHVSLILSSVRFNKFGRRTAKFRKQGFSSLITASKELKLYNAVSQLMWRDANSFEMRTLIYSHHDCQLY